MISTFYYDDEDRKRHLKLEKQMKKDEEMTRIDSYAHGSKKLFRLKKQVEARSFSIKCFRYIRNGLFFFGALLTVFFFDVPVTQNDLHSFVWLCIWNLLVGFFVLTLALYLLSLFYFPLCKALYYVVNRKKKNPYPSSGNMAQDTKKMYADAQKICKEALSLWSDWWEASYVKRSRILKIVTALGCGTVAFLKGYSDINSNIHTLFNDLGLFAEKMSDNQLLLLCEIALGFVLVVYFMLWLVFYFSDKMILTTQMRRSAVTKCEKFERRFYEYWCDNDPVEKARYWDEINQHAEERALDERLRISHNSYTSTSSSPPDFVVVPRIDVSDM